MSASLARLMGVIDALLGPGGCPWDKKQTPQTLTDYIIEEGFELVDAIQSNRVDDAREELGDVLFLILFVARLYGDQGAFTLDDSLEESAAKMIRRHPHVFADTRLANQEELLRNWERIKRSEKGGEGDAPVGVYASLPKGLPPMLKAYRIHSKAARAGFTWETDKDMEAQLADEWREWREAEASGDKERMEQEFGDYLFTLIELGRRKGIKANAALGRSNLKFLDRFAAMETMARERGVDIATLPLDEQNALWEAVKKR
ncbi:MAG: nucleoside triphosphate pyrophosphohydrolase [Desulfovibrionaceae bacterium]